MKSLKKFISRDVARHVCTSIVAAMCILPACSDYLDVVPDKSFTMESIFATRDVAYNALAKAYNYLPNDTKRSSRWLLGDEWVNPSGENTQYNLWLPIRIMERRQTASSTDGTYPALGTWSGTGGGKPLYEAINTCSIIFDKIDGVNDMEFAEKADWKAQVKFLKAYYHFLLLQQYGPIVISDRIILPDEEPAKMFVSRSKIDDCFNYIVKTIDEAIPDLEVRRTGSNIGQIDKMGAAAIKAKVLLFRASPFYSGNGELVDFLDHDGKPFFPQDDAARTKTKWEDAVKAINEAITLCEGAGVQLYKYNKRMLLTDIEDAKRNPRLDTLYDLRMVICDRDNNELIWGNTNVTAGNDDLFSDGNIVLPASFTAIYTRGSTDYCSNSLGATYKTLERYYTKNGLPLDEDNTFDRSTMHDPAVTPDTNVVNEYRGILQSNQPTINLYLNRELRFYANVGITGGYWRSHGERIETTFFAGGAGNMYPTTANNYFWTAIGAQKQVHINNMARRDLIVTYPTPIIRLADLYLMKAEALNESQGPGPDVWGAINKVRRRAGIPDVEAAYTGPFVKPAPISGKHTTQAGMRAIIRQERMIEFAFEGHIFWDMLRYGNAPYEFSTPVVGWTYNAQNAAFFNQRVLQSRVFTLRDCLWPIDQNELDRNSNLIQNPGW